MKRRSVTTAALAVLAILLSLGQPIGRGRAAPAAAARAQATGAHRAFLPLVGKPYRFTNLAPNPVQVNAVLDQARAVSATVPLSGGTLTATAADGTRFTLTFPADALLAEEDITMTPLTTVNGLPFSGGFVAGVDLKPWGLRLFQPATLTIEPPSPIPPAEETAFAYRNLNELIPSGELYLYPLQLGTDKIVFQLLHFSGYGVGKATAAERTAQQKRVPSTYEDRLRQQMADLLNYERYTTLIGEPGDPDYESKMTGLLQDYYDNILKPILASAEKDCGFAESYFPKALYWLRLLTLAAISFGADDGVFDTEEIAINDAYVTSLNNCLAQATKPCINRQDPAQMAKIARWIRQLQLLGIPPDDPRFNLDQYPQCSCGQFAGVQSWTGTISFSYARSGSGDGLTITMQHGGNVTFHYAEPRFNSGIIQWEAASVAGTGQINNSYVRPYPDGTGSDRGTLIGSGSVVPVGPDAFLDSSGNLRFVESTCSYAFYLGIKQYATYTQYGQSTESIRGLGFMNVQDIPIQTTGTTLSGSRTVPVIVTFATSDTPSWYGPGAAWITDLGRMLGAGNLGDATVSWSFSPSD